ncbi:hypothetical protein M3201_23150 [Paenibacillus motobuensis]|uniref:hypothetical protein n=1 Tax=Paenibacillus TaxID=44249 RepID=UPI00203C8464|nr:MULTISPECIES: hypothetical protein [Paenibacillus]MCM3042556.1 hypothetical protein [Paenibacillus lutimineralis]MCM3649660.1 hypothetical protein [Paenibacillus motobuensis]
MDHRDKQEKQQIEEYKKNPTINMADSMNRSVSGDLGAMTKGSFLTRIISTLVIIGGLIVFLLLK